MKRLALTMAAMTLVAPLVAFAAPDAGKPDPTFGTRLSDCSAFFGLLSQSQSEIAEGMKGFALAATAYAIVAFADDRQAAIEVGKSTVSLADEFPNLSRDRAAFENKFLTCVSALKAAELELRPRMDEITKNLVPEMFGEK